MHAVSIRLKNKNNYGKVRAELGFFKPLVIFKIAKILKLIFF